MAATEKTEKTEATPKKPLDRIADRFDALGKDLRHRARLASEEAKSAWDRAHLERITDEIARAREDARVQLHLASLDARDAFRDAEKRMDALRSAAGVEVDHVAEDLGKHIHHLASALRGEKPAPPAADPHSKS